MASLYRCQIEDWLRSQSFTADQVLDIGGGDGKTNRLAKIEAGRYLVLDNNRESKPDFFHDLNEFAHPSDIFAVERTPYFDLIFCMNVMEYIWNPYNAMANIYHWLIPGGTVVMNFPLLYPLHNPIGIDYLRYTHEWVDKIFHQRFKYSQVELYPLQATAGQAALNEFYSLEKMHRRKHDDSWLELGTIIKARK